ncbi:MAG: hypothetical protein KIT80_18105 [Chitinophagaceae bacterium]|nr:hypothetical protein [Chitinophagaceae bacterium]MCW5928839.1 hypothetical protein [Chitinophagaceae bacterium]
MPKRSTDELFQLIKSLEKAEKRNFKLFVQRNAAGSDMKTVQLFDALDKLDDYDEETLLRRNKDIRKQQLSNLKASLYRQILASIRVLKDDHTVQLQLNELMDYARILYNKGLYLQSLKALAKIKEDARTFHQLTYCLQALLFEKKIETLYITRSIENRAETLAKEVEEINDQISMVSRLSNLSLQLYSWYIQLGHARDEKDRIAVKAFFESNLPKGSHLYKGFYEQHYLYQGYCWYSFILQDLLTYYRYCQKWVDAFEREPAMKNVDTQMYLKGMHNLLNAHFMLLNYDKFGCTLRKLEEFYHSKEANSNDNNRIQTFIYLYTAKVNKHFLEGSFTEGLQLVPEIESKIEEFRPKMDRHRILVFYYKIASLYFGSGDNEKTIEYLNRIINLRVDLRTDLQCYSRLLHLIAHYELGNYDLLEYLIKSVYRFMAKMQNLSVVEEEIFRFLRKSFHLDKKQVRSAFVALKNKLEKYKDNPLESRSFMYLDIISWLESKMKNVPVQDIIREKYLKAIANKQKHG